MMKATHYLLPIISMIFILSCEKENKADLSVNKIDDHLIGEWTVTTNADPTGLIIYDLKIDTNWTYSYKVSLYGLYSGQQNEDISSWSEMKGSLKQKHDSIFVKSQTNTWWDGFSEMSPETEYTSQSNFEFWCTYMIVKDTLKTTYLSYPYDAPIVTQKNYIRK